MSTTVIVRKGNKAVIGADTQFMMGSIIVSSRHRVNHHKIHAVGEAYVAFTGWSLMQNIFDDVIERYPGELNFGSRQHIFRTFLFLHEKIKGEYFVESRERTDQPVESSQWNCVIACPAGIFEVDSYRTVIEYDRFWADGSGLRFALGAMHSTYDTLTSPLDIAKAGLQAACDFDEASGAPMKFHTVTLKGKK